MCGSSSSIVSGLSTGYRDRASAVVFSLPEMCFNIISYCCKVSIHRSIRAFWYAFFISDVNGLWSVSTTNFCPSMYDRNFCVTLHQIANASSSMAEYFFSDGFKLLDTNATGLYIGSDQGGNS